jgi:hypothetical protein
MRAKQIRYYFNSKQRYQMLQTLVIQHGKYDIRYVISDYTFHTHKLILLIGIIIIWNPKTHHNDV